MNAKTAESEEDSEPGQEAPRPADAGEDPRSRKLRELLAETLIARLTEPEAGQDDRRRA